jgi:hypothetical protein
LGKLTSVVLIVTGFLKVTDVPVVTITDKLVVNDTTPVVDDICSIAIFLLSTVKVPMFRMISPGTNPTVLLRDNDVAVAPDDVVVILIGDLLT